MDDTHCPISGRRHMRVAINGEPRCYWCRRPWADCRAEALSDEPEPPVDTAESVQADAEPQGTPAHLIGALINSRSERRS